MKNTMFYFMMTLLLISSAGLTGSLKMPVRRNACQFDCNAVCRLKGEQRGRCVAGKCLCQDRKRIKHKDSKSFEIVMDSRRAFRRTMEKKCKYDCNRHCQLRGNSTGFCRNGRCACQGPGVLRGPSRRSLRVREKRKPCQFDCNAVCQIRGERRGRCEGGKCVCQNRRSAKQADSDSFELIIERRRNMGTVEEEDACRYNCTELCSMWSGKAGVCVVDQCICQPRYNHSTLTTTKQQKER